MEGNKRNRLSCLGVKINDKATTPWLNSLLHVNRLSSNEFIMLLRTQSEALDPSGFSFVPLLRGMKETITGLLGKRGY